MSKALDMLADMHEQVGNYKRASELRERAEWWRNELNRA